MSNSSGHSTIWIIIDCCGMGPDSWAGGIAWDPVWVEVNSIIAGEREGDVSSRDRGVILILILCS